MGCKILYAFLLEKNCRGDLTSYHYYGLSIKGKNVIMSVICFRQMKKNGPLGQKSLGEYKMIFVFIEQFRAACHLSGI